MFKLEVAGDGSYKITFGNRVAIKARTCENAVNALKHYFMLRHNKRKCPSCDPRDWKRSPESNIVKITGQMMERNDEREHEGLDEIKAHEEAR